MRRVLALLPWFAGLFGFFAGVLLAFVVLEVWLGMHDAGGTKLSVVLALAPAVLAFDLTGRVIGRLFPEPESSPT